MPPSLEGPRNDLCLQAARDFLDRFAVNMLRTAFTKTMKDTEFLAAADKAKLEISAITGQEMHELVESIYRMPKDVATTAAAMMQGAK